MITSGAGFSHELNKTRILSVHLVFVRSCFQRGYRLKTGHKTSSVINIKLGLFFFLPSS